MVICDSGIINACMEHGWKDLKGQDLYLELQKEQTWHFIKMCAINGENNIGKNAFAFSLTDDNKEKLKFIFEGYGYKFDICEGNVYTVSW